MSQSAEQLRKAFRVIERLETEVASLRRAPAEPVAVVGLSCRFPGAESVDAFWSLLHNGEEGISEVPRDRWDIDAFYDADPDAPGKMSTRYGGFLKGIDQFDASFFGISPREAALMDPQQRLLLELAWEALESGALSPDALYGSATGIFIGICTSDYHRLAAQDIANVNAYWGTGNATSVAAGRISYTFGFTGPCLSIDTACSSALVAVHYACDSLYNGECDLALAGSANVILAPEATVAFSNARMMAPDGRCKTFDERANGYVRSEGAGVVVLKRLSRAQADGDRIFAVIRGSAVNQDGASGGLTVPNGPSQVKLIRQALARAGVEPGAIDYIEAHGTGTALGDPIEVGALGEVFGASHGADRPLPLGSVKTAIGHVEVAAGMAGLIKVVLSLENDLIPAAPSLQRLSSRIPWQELPFVVPVEPRPWPRRERPRLAGVSSFGFSGTNAHVVIQEAPALPEPQVPVRPQPSHLLCLSAKTPRALTALAQRYAGWLQAHPSATLESICWSANNGRARLVHRLALRAQRLDELRDKLAAFARDGDTASGGVQHAVAPAVQKGLAFLFSGQGAQYAGMGRELYEWQPYFRATIDRCEEILSAQLDVPLKEVLWGRHADKLDQTAYTQPALFALEYALAKLWQSWGIVPSYVMGHSVGELAAACFAGVFSLEDGLKLIGARGRLMQALPGDGAMAVILAGADALETALKGFRERVSIAAFNAPDQTVVSGEREAVLELCDRLQSRHGIRNKGLLGVSHAFHSPLMRPMLAELKAVAETVTYSPPMMGLVSNVTGRLAAQEVATADYWVDHVLAPVDFMSGMRELRANKAEMLLEIGPQATLIGLARACCAADAPASIASLRRNASDWSQMLDCLGTLFVEGFDPDWRRAGRCEQPPPPRQVLPTYPFQRQRHWLSDASRPARAVTGEDGPHPLLGRRLPNAALAAGDLQYEGILSPRGPRYLQDHKVYEKVVVPGAAYLEMALAGIARQFPGAVPALVNVSVHTALVLPLQDEALVQSLFSDSGGNRYRFKLFSTIVRAGASPAADAPWQTHAAAEIELLSGDGAKAPPAVDLDNLRRRFEELGERLEVPEFYRRYAAHGLQYGADFQTVRRLQLMRGGASGAAQCLAEIVLPEGLRGGLSDYVIHPALLDGCFQALGAAMPAQDRGVAYLPVGVERLCVWRTPPAQLWTHATLRPRAGTRVVADVRLLDDEGRIIGTVQGLRAVPVERRALAYATSGWKDKLYAVKWMPQAREKTAPPAPVGGGGWLILCDGGGRGERLAALLESWQQRCVLVRSGDFAFGEKSEWAGLIARRFRDASLSLTGIVHLWALDRSDESDAQSLTRVQQRLCGSTLALLQALMELPDQRLPRLWLVTQEAQAVADAEPVNAAAGTLWGFGRTITLEHPALNCTCIDIDAALTDPAAIGAEFLDPEAEPQIAYRGGRRFVARLSRSAPVHAPQGLTIPSESYRLRASEYGSLDRLTLLPAQRPAPAGREVEIEVRAASINFKDVLYCLGMLKAFSEQEGIMRAADQPLGFECAGRITRVGAAETEFKIGDDVFAMAPSAMASHVTVDRRFVHRKPRRLTFEEAASLPTVFMTAIYSLEKLAKVKAGDKVLIHAAGGGVGQAALQIARKNGATVYATASPAKWRYLKQQGVAHVMNSRTLDFADEVMRITGGRGVDIVINSLSGDYIVRSADVLARGGRFVEIGKIGIWDAARMTAHRPDIEYYAFDLGEVENEGALQAELLADVVSGLEAGFLTPLPVKSFPIQQAEAGFRYLAQAKNIGKVVLSLPSAGDSGEAVRPDRSYLITGGWGALGLHVARSLIASGARQLVLSGRSAPGGEVRKALDALSEAGAEIHVKPMDVADPAQVAAVLADIARELNPLGGIVHAAGVLDDGVIVKQSWPRFESVLAPKVAGTWNLHAASAELKLDFFVMFSSIASVVGAPGQANYAAANAFMDALACHRRSRGLPATCINWGPWAAGMAETTRPANRARFESFGLGRLSAQDSVEVFEFLLDKKSPPVAVMDVNWPKYLKSLRNSAIARFYSLVDRGSALGRADEGGALLNRLAEEPEASRERVLIDYLRSQVASVVGLPAADQIELQQPLLSLGIDSLMAVELKNRVESALRCTLNPTLLLDYPTLETLGAHLIRNVLNLGSPAAAPQAPAAEGPAVVGDGEARVAGALSTMQEFFLGDGEGRKLCVCRWGAEDAPPVICVHGILDQAAIWDEVAAGLVEKGYGVMAPDLRGHGRSDHHPAGVNVSVMDFLVDLVTLVTRTLNRPFILVGHSIGSVVCSLYAGLHPDNVSHLVMVEPVVPALRERQPPLELLANDLQYVQAAPAHPVYPDLATAARMLTMSHGKLDAGRSMGLAQRITEPCEGGLRWRWDARLRNPMGADLYLPRERYLSMVSALEVGSTRIYGTTSQFAGTPVLLDPDVALPGAQSVSVAGGHNLHTDNAAALLQVILERVHYESMRN